MRPTSSDAATSAPREAASASTRATISCSAAASQSSTFILTCTKPARGRSRPSARTPGKPPPVSRAAAEVDVERDQRPAGADDHPARALVELRRAEVGLELARIEPPLQLLGTAAAKERGPSTSRELPVEEYRQRELAADRTRDLARAHTRPLEVLRSDRNDGDDVRSADARMRPFVRAEVDPLACDRDGCEQSGDDLPLDADEREHGTVVVGVRMHVEQPGVPLECIADRVDRPAVPAFREVRHGFEGAHVRTLGSR